MENSLNNLAKEIYKNNVDKGFYEKPSSTGERLMLIVSELSEALEADRKPDKEGRADRPGFEDIYQTDITDNRYKELFEEFIKNSFEDEIADSIIRLLDLCGNQEIDIDWHIEQKLKYNKLREYKHGKKY